MRNRRQFQNGVAREDTRRQRELDDRTLAIDDGRPIEKGSRKIAGRDRTEDVRQGAGTCKPQREATRRVPQPDAESKRARTIRCEFNAGCAAISLDRSPRQIGKTNDGIVCNY